MNELLPAAYEGLLSLLQVRWRRGGEEVGGWYPCCSLMGACYSLMGACPVLCSRSTPVHQEGMEVLLSGLIVMTTRPRAHTHTPPTADL